MTLIQGIKAMKMKRKRFLASDLKVYFEICNMVRRRLMDVKQTLCFRKATILDFKMFTKL